MATFFVRHKVNDFGVWKAAYDAFDSERGELGVTGDGVYQADDDPNDVTVYHHFNSMDEAKSFMANPRLLEVMQSAGVVGKPEIWLVNRV